MHLDAFGLQIARMTSPFHQCSEFNELTVPINLINCEQAVDFPLLLGLALTVFGGATLAHVLFASVARGVHTS